MVEILSMQESSRFFAGIVEKDFGTISDGRRAKIYTLEHSKGPRIRVTDFGATLVSCELPDPSGTRTDLILGYDSVTGYEGTANPYFGATVGRFGNRIAKGRFTLDGKDYQLATNNDPNGILCHLHGGVTGFGQVIWTATPAADGRSISFQHFSPDGEEGYPGNLKVTVTYTITDEGELIWEAKAETDAPTVLNLVNHSYWNLSGDPGSPITDHELTLYADEFLEIDAGMIPTGELILVSGTPMDFTQARIIGERIDDDFEPLKIATGYDHCWVLSAPRQNDVAPAARLKDPKSGRILEISTNQPGLQLYTANWIHESLFTGENPPGKGGTIYSKNSGCCLETENFPNAPNQPSFPSAVLRPGETYHHILIHRFSLE